MSVFTLVRAKVHGVYMQEVISVCNYQHDLFLFVAKGLWKRYYECRKNNERLNGNMLTYSGTIDIRCTKAAVALRVRGIPETLATLAREEDCVPASEVDRCGGSCVCCV